MGAQPPKGPSALIAAFGSGYKDVRGEIVFFCPQ